MDSKHKHSVDKKNGTKHSTKNKFLQLNYSSLIRFYEAISAND